MIWKLNILQEILKVQHKFFLKNIFQQENTEKHKKKCDYGCMGFLGSSDGRESSIIRETQVQSLGQKDPQRREWQPIPVFLPGEDHGVAKSQT